MPVVYFETTQNDSCAAASLVYLQIQCERNIVLPSALKRRFCINIYMYHSISNNSLSQWDELSVLVLLYIISRNRIQGPLRLSELRHEMKGTSRIKRQNESVSTETPVLFCSRTCYCSSEKWSLLTKGDFTSLVKRISHNNNCTNIQLFLSQLWKDGTFEFEVGVAVGVTHLLHLLRCYLTSTTEQNHAALTPVSLSTLSQTVQMDFSCSSGCSSVTTTLCHWATIWSRWDSSLSWSSAPDLTQSSSGLQLVRFSNALILSVQWPYPLDTIFIILNILGTWVSLFSLLLSGAV